MAMLAVANSINIVCGRILIFTICALQLTQS